MHNHRVYLVILVAALLFFLPGGTLVVHAGAFTGCANVTQIPAAECSALVAFYNATSGAGWTNHTNWLATDTPGDWYGVTVTGGHVTQIVLIKNQLSGSIPAQLSDLTDLQLLELSQNAYQDVDGKLIGGLTGSIPPELGSLANLLDLDLFENQLTGSIPPELGNLANLLDLTLVVNQLSGSIPVELSSLANLRSLDLRVNQLTGSIPAQLGSLANLQGLYLGVNQLNGSIPVELSSLANLRSLDLSVNQLSGSIPTQLGSLANLLDLELPANQLSGNIPVQLGSLANLRTLDLGFNQLSGSIPAQLGSLANLRTLDLHSNLLSGSIPLSFTALVQLGYFNAACTGLDEPQDSSFQAWKATVATWSSPGPCFSISGQVKLGANPLPGVDISDDGGHSTTSRADGTYALLDLPPASYTLTPSLPGYTFTPLSISVTITNANVTGQDFSASVKLYLPLVMRH